LNKFLADAGISSRRQADRIIAAGRVRVNGAVITEMGYMVDPEKDQVTVDGQALILPEKFEYWIMHKPAGYLTSVGDPFGRPTVMDLLPSMQARIYPVGRLDLDTSGLLFFTNDGELALALTHPRHWVEKVYQAKVKGIPSQGTLKRLAEGVDLEDGRTAPAKVEIEAAENGYAIVRLTIREGRKRQVRRMLRTVGHPVVALHRLAVGPLWLGPLAPGKIRRPTPEELDALLQLKKLAIR